MLKHTKTETMITDTTTITTNITITTDILYKHRGCGKKLADLSVCLNTTGTHISGFPVGLSVSLFFYLLFYIFAPESM